MNTGKNTFLKFVNVSYETIHRLSLYEEMIISWNQKFNLVSENTISQIWTRHFLDSAQIMKYIPKSAQSLADMGSGAGFPGIVLALLAKEAGRELKVFLIESTKKKARFLKAVAEELKIKVTVREERIEDIKDLKADVITARALTALPELLKYANCLKKKETVFLFLKGARYAEELTEASKYWKFAIDIHPSLTDDSGRVLVMKNLEKGPRQKEK